VKKNIGGKYLQHKSKRGIRSKRGISTVVASILVLAITVALAVGLLTFGSSFMASQQKIQPPTTDQIKIENVHFVDSTHVQVAVRNVGTGNATVTDIYVNGALCTISPTSKQLAYGQVQEFTVTTTISMVSNQAYTIKAATSNGGENTYTATYS
jgi:flagellin-like protein